MKTIRCFFFLFLIFAFVSCDDVDSDLQTQEYYQIKVYTFDSDDQVKTTENYLKTALLPGLKRIGIEQVGVLKSRPSESDTSKSIFVIIPFSSLDQFQALESELAKDENYKSAGAEYLNASHDNPPYMRIESTLLKAFAGMPFMKTPALNGERSKRVYELRSYHSANEAYHKKKVEMFNEGGEIELFKSLNFNAVFYAQVISGSTMPNLMYMITFSDEESQQSHWNAFVSSDKWSELKVMPKYLNTVSHIDKYLLYPTEYSDY